MSATPPRCVRALLGSVLVLVAEERAGSIEEVSLDAGKIIIMLDLIQV